MGVYSIDNAFFCGKVKIGNEILTYPFKSFCILRMKPILKQLACPQRCLDGTKGNLRKGRSWHGIWHEDPRMI